MTDSERNLVEEYNEILEHIDIDESNIQWFKEGDIIEEFNLFDNYPIPYSSYDTELI